LSGGVYHSWGQAVSADGSTIVGTATSADGEEPVRWTTAGGGPVRLGTLANGGPVGRANAVNGDGSVIVGQAMGELGPVAFRWTGAGGMESLGTVSPGTSEATGVSSDGSVIVGNSSMFNQGYGSGPFIWDASHGMRDLTDVLTSEYGLNLDGWLLTNAQGISADGSTIVGTALNQLGQMQAYAVVVPEPGSVMLLVLSAAPLLARRRRGSI
jgi:uncharacterized membrane protein